MSIRREFDRIKHNINSLTKTDDLTTTLEFSEGQLSQLRKVVNNSDDIETDGVYTIESNINKIQEHLEEIHKVEVAKLTGYDQNGQSEQK